MSQAPICTRAVLLFAGLLCSSALVRAQESEIDPQSVRATRQQLEALQRHYDAAARSRAYSDQLRAFARDRAGVVRQRLAEGDFGPGDWVVMAVEGEPALSDTFLVTRDRSVELPNVGRVSLRGVLRSELETHLTDQIGRYINDPVVHAPTYLRIAVSGEVLGPGYYLMPAETPVSEAIMLAGGPTSTAKLSKVEIKRGTEGVWGGESLQLAIREGRTLAELNLLDGDQIDVPRRAAFGASEIAPMLLVVSSVVVALSAVF